MCEEVVYKEVITSNRTEALFLSLAVLFLISFFWRLGLAGWDVLAILFLIFFLFFAFYSLNFRTLRIRLDQEALTLKFGLISWKVPRENIANCALDEIPAFLKYGGAGVHFMTVRGRYRASFNFLEYPGSSSRSSARQVRSRIFPFLPAGRRSSCS